MDSNQALVQFLLANKLLQEKPSEELLRGSKDLPILALSEKGFFDELTAISALAKHLSIEYLDLRNKDTALSFDFESFAKTIRAEECWKHRLLPLFEDESGVTVAFANPLDFDAVKKLEFIFSKPIRVVVAEEAKIIRLLGTHFPQTKQKYQLAFGTSVGAKVELANSHSLISDVANIEHDAPPIVKLTNKIIADAVKLNASDIHIEPSQAKLSVRFRIDGVMQDVIEVPKRLQPTVIARLKIISGLDIAERRRPQDGRLRVTVNDEPIDMRVSSIPTADGEKLVLRILRSDYENLGFDSLGMSPKQEQQFQKALLNKGKLLLVTGPTGAGKTTTLYVALNSLKDGRTNITTIEDPIEYRFPGLNQIQTNKATEVTFASALRSVLRQDPDIIMIGEIRDGETLSSVLQAAQTGHLVLSTVHTNDAPSAVSRLLTLGADPYVLASSLAGILAQRLVRKVCPDCQRTVSDHNLSEFQEYLEQYSIDPRKLREGKGCPSCYHTGYKGRLGIYSYLDVNDSIADLILSRASNDKIVSRAMADGYQSIESEAVKLLSAGITTFSEVRPFLGRTEPQVPQPSLPPPTTLAKVESVTTNVPPVKTQVSRPTVLLIDDSRDVRRMLATLLKKDMVDVVEAENGMEALNQIYERMPQIIVCDISMPVMDGKEFLHRVKANKQTRDIPVIMLTVDDTEETELELLKLGVREFLSKRSSPTRIVGRIRNILSLL